MFVRGKIVLYKKKKFEKKILPINLIKNNNG